MAREGARLFPDGMIILIKEKKIRTNSRIHQAYKYAITLQEFKNL